MERIGVCMFFVKLGEFRLVEEETILLWLNILWLNILWLNISSPMAEYLLLKHSLLCPKSKMP